jgi:hypothetical protein
MFVRNFRYSVLIDKAPRRLPLYRCQNITSRRFSFSLYSESSPSAPKTPDLNLSHDSNGHFAHYHKQPPRQQQVLFVLVKRPYSTLTQFTVPYPSLSKNRGSVTSLATSELDLRIHLHFPPCFHTISFATHSTSTSLGMSI